MENIKNKHKEGVQLFVNKELELEVRAVEINGEGWLIGKDVAEALGYSNVNDALKKHVDDEDKCKRDEIAISDTIGRMQKLGLNDFGTKDGSQEMTVIIKDKKNLSIKLSLEFRRLLRGY